MFKSMWKDRSAPPPLLLDVAPSPGLFFGTKVATSYDWTPVEDLAVGDIVLTGENGEQPITGIRVEELSIASVKAAVSHWPLLIPQDALGNDKTALMAPKTRFVVELPEAAELFDFRRVSIKAESLIGYYGIARARLDQTFMHVTLEFDDPQMLVIDGGLLLDATTRRNVPNTMPLNDRQTRMLARELEIGHVGQMARTNEIAWI